MSLNENAICALKLLRQHFMRASFTLVPAPKLTGGAADAWANVIRISPYSSYPYIVYITLPCIVRPSLVFVVCKQLLKHLWLFFAVVQLQSCIGIDIQRDVHA